MSVRPVMADKDPHDLIALHRRRLVDLSLEYIELAHRIQDLSPEERNRMNAIERAVYDCFEALDEEAARQLSMHFSVFAQLVYQYRIYPDSLGTMH